MPSASSSRGRREGLTDSLIRRFTKATTASDAGSSISSPTSTVHHGADQPGRYSNQTTSNSEPNSMAAR